LVVNTTQKVKITNLPRKSTYNQISKQQHPKKRNSTEFRHAIMWLESRTLLDPYSAKMKDLTPCAMISLMLGVEAFEKSPKQWWNKVDPG